MCVKLAGGTIIEQELAQYLLDIGVGKLPVTRDIGHFKVCIPDDLVAKSYKVDDLCQLQVKFSVMLIVTLQQLWRVRPLRSSVATIPHMAIISVIFLCT